ncbi:hypothetical protein [Eubacterium oxidoreducens]|nr:hypothetical protein [Eubacterium oxidoreducens]
MIRILFYSLKSADYLVGLLQKKEFNLAELSATVWKDLDWRLVKNVWIRIEGETIGRQVSEPLSFYDAVIGMCRAHSTYESNEGRRFSSREELFRFLYKNDNELTLSYEIADFVRKGKAVNEKWKWEKYIEKARITPEAVSACEKCKYLWPESHCIDYMLLYGMIEKCENI